MEVPQLLFFSGKGGVGKTTCASGLSFSLAKNGYKVLTISTDPAHSLGDAFDCNLTPGIITRYRNQLKLYLLELSFSDKEPSKSNFFKELVFPSSEEFLIVTELGLILTDLIKSEKIFDYIVIDMAPSGHTIRLLQFPEKLKKYFRKITNLSGKLNKIAGREDNGIKSSRLSNKTIIKRLDIFIQALKNPKITQFMIVGIPEYMSYIESKRLYSILENLQIPCSNYIINKVEEFDNEHVCRFCSKRQESQKEVIKKINQEFNDLKITQINLYSDEINGNYSSEEIYQHFSLLSETRTYAE